MKSFVPVAVLSIAFALVEAAVVVYLRELYYPEGFSFPLKPIPPDIMRIESMREAATMAMIVSIGFLAGKSGWSRLSFFMFSFGLWDIFYYVWLKVFIGWPESFLTPDVLFLIPVVWRGPVLAPVIVAFSICASGLYIVKREEAGKPVSLLKTDIVWIVFGAGIILYTFMADAALVEAGVEELPPYNWPLFLAGEGVGVFAFIRGMRRGD